ncbi:MAG: hypothetical protein ACYC6M_09345 [Terriglobales bacterium]
MEQPEAKQVREYLNAIALALARLDALADGDEKRALIHTANRALRAIEAIVNRDELEEREEHEEHEEHDENNRDRGKHGRVDGSPSRAVHD